MKPKNIGRVPAEPAPAAASELQMRSAFTDRNRPSMGRNREWLWMSSRAMEGSVFFWLDVFYFPLHSFEKFRYSAFTCRHMRRHRRRGCR